ncbi:MAG: capsule biosynthesis GfcC family protein [Candidatus Bipolaricaulota bacterium]
MPHDLVNFARMVSLAAVITLPLSAHASIKVELQRGDQEPTSLTLPARARLADALGRGDAKDDCPMQRAWLRPSARKQQHMLQKGLVYDLEVLAQQATLDADRALAAWAHAQARLIASMEITGRIPGQRLDLERLEAIPAENRLLRDGDRILMPGCSDSIRILQGGTLQVQPYRPGAMAEDYLGHIPQERWHQPGELIVVHGTGHIERIRVGHWRSVAPSRPGAGALLFRPLRDEVLDGINPALNEELARWFATQVWVDAH